MHCDRCRPLLTALTDSELRPAAAWRVRRHLARCAACAALYADLRRVDDAARALRAATDAAPVPVTLAARVQDATRATSRQPDPYPEEKPMSPVAPTPAFWAAAWKPAFATVAVTAGIAAVTFGPGGGRTAVAKPSFSEVRRAIQSIHTVHVRYWMRIEGVEEEIAAEKARDAAKPSKGAPDPADAAAEAVGAEMLAMVAGKSPLIDGWADLDRPALSMRMVMGMRLFSDARGTTLYGMGGKPTFSREKPVTRESLQKALLSPESLMGKFDGEKAVPGEPPAQWSLGEPTQIDGRPALRFTASGPTGVDRVFWADPETHLPLRYEVRVDETKLPKEERDEEDEEAGKVTITATFEYGQTPPPGTFTAPAAP